VAAAEPDDSTATPMRPAVYKVRAGDTLSAIAKRVGATVDQLMNWNKLRGSKLNIGDRLVVSNPRAANAQQ
jgi:membrane-bound lytic murein transglycosylase D